MRHYGRVVASEGLELDSYLGILKVTQRRQLAASDLAWNWGFEQQNNFVFAYSYCVDGCTRLYHQRLQILLVFPNLPLGLFILGTPTRGSKNGVCNDQQRGAL